ncbi:WXG100 family type VII secretion target [Rhodococcus sp. NPDC058521]|uniref:WXG100 family type VII secretion target n=1 Tax=Rhodococcus sp. NPDC058521 TaxID=3346536 RepID=UPI003664E1CA
MSDQLRVDLEQFRSFVPRFEQLEAQTVVDKWHLTRGLDEEGECWGADEVGASFASKYVPASRDTIEAIDALGQLFDLIGDKVGRTADGFEQTETAFTGQIGSIDPTSGG